MTRFFEIHEETSAECYYKSESDALTAQLAYFEVTPIEQRVHVNSFETTTPGKWAIDCKSDEGEWLGFLADVTPKPADYEIKATFTRRQFEILLKMAQLELAFRDSGEKLASYDEIDDLERRLQLIANQHRQRGPSREEF